MFKSPSALNHVRDYFSVSAASQRRNGERARTARNNAYIGATMSHRVHHAVADYVSFAAAFLCRLSLTPSLRLFPKNAGIFGDPFSQTAYRLWRFHFLIHEFYTNFRTHHKSGGAFAPPLVFIRPPARYIPPAAPPRAVRPRRPRFPPRNPSCPPSA